MSRAGTQNKIKQNNAKENKILHHANFVIFGLHIVHLWGLNAGFTAPGQTLGFLDVSNGCDGYYAAQFVDFLCLPLINWY